MTTRHFSDDRIARSDFLDDLHLYKSAELVSTPGKYVKILSCWIDGNINDLDSIAYFTYESENGPVWCDESELKNFTEE